MYLYDDLEKYITRGEAVELIFSYLKDKYPTIESVLNTNEAFISEYTDQEEITNEGTRKAINACSQYGIINGFSDGTFRVNETLTRAQAAKILYLAGNL